MDPQMHDRLVEGDGFIAAVDQSGGTTPKALRQYDLATRCALG